MPLLEEGGIEAFLRREALPYAADAWYVPDSIKVGYEISFTRHFYKPQLLHPLEEIRTDILALERETEGLLAEIVGGSNHLWPLLPVLCVWIVFPECTHRTIIDYAHQLRLEHRKEPTTHRTAGNIIRERCLRHRARQLDGCAGAPGPGPLPRAADLRCGNR